MLLGARVWDRKSGVSNIHLTQPLMITAAASNAAAADDDHLLINGKSISVEPANRQAAATR